MKGVFKHGCICIAKKVRIAIAKQLRGYDRDEMEYIEGGFPRWCVSIPVDALLLATPLGLAMAPLKYLGRTAAISLLKRYAGTLSGIIGWAVTKAVGAAGSALFNITGSSLLNLLIPNLGSFTSIGGIVAFAADYFSDGAVNNNIVL